MRAAQLAISLVVALITLAAGSQAQTGVPRLVRISGVVGGSSGPRVAAIVFSLYDEETAAAAQWSEIQNVKIDGAGNYSVLLGSEHAEGLPAELFTAQRAHWLGIQVEGEAEARTRMASVPYAFRAGEADTLGGMTLQQILGAAASAWYRGAAEPEPATGVSERVTRPGRVGGSASALGAHVHIEMYSPSSGQVHAFDDGTGTPLALLMNPAGGNVGIGLANPGERLSVAGTVESTAGGFRFPDGTLQTSAASEAPPGVTSVSSAGGSGLTVLPASGAVVLNTDAALLQRRVNAAGCASGSSIRVIHEDGSVLCQLDTNSGGAVNAVSAAAGSGLYASTTGGNVTLGTDTTVAKTGSANAFTTSQSMPKLGVGQMAGTEALEVSGNIKTTGSLKFGDGSALASASTFIPSGYSIMGSSPLVPGGFVADGWTARGGAIPWTSRAGLNTGRWGAAAGIYNDGQTKIVVGGYTGGAYLSAAEYEHGDQTWFVISNGGSQPTARAYSAYAQVGNDLYMIGGTTSSGSTAANEKFNTQTYAWTTGLATMGGSYEARTGACAVAVGTDLYVFGGLSGAVFLKDVRVYHTSGAQANTWETKNGQMIFARAYFTCFACAGKIYAYGGYTSATATTASVEVYDPATDLWTAKTQSGQSLAGASAIVAANLAYVFGGEHVSGSSKAADGWVGIYSPEQDRWYYQSPLLPTARAFANSFYSAGQIRVVGGNTWASVATQGTPTTVNEMFDTAAIMYLYKRN